MKVHFIAIGGSAMHNLAIALKRKGYIISGSDDEIFEPSLSRLKKEGILPKEMGWNDTLITSDLDAVILGMHAREDNPELLKAKELGIKIYSYPEYLYEQSKHKKRIVIAGSHGKTTITSMLLHVANKLKINIDYMVGAQLEGYDCMVKLSDNAPFMILEGDEYLSSPIDRRPKFHLYQPNIAILSGIAWDHINVFPTFENYVQQFDHFCSLIDESLIYNSQDNEVEKIAKKYQSKIKTIPYSTPTFEVINEETLLHHEGKTYQLQIFGQHNLQNLMGAMLIGKQIGISDEDFLTAIQSFTGAGKRLQKMFNTDNFVIFKDFAHSPSKLKATINAVIEQYPSRKIIACMELHTFSSLNKAFLSQYQKTMKGVYEAIVYFNPKVLEHKKLPPITEQEIMDGFDQKVIVITKTSEILDYLLNITWENSVLLMMSSGNFDNLDYDLLISEIKTQLKI